MLKFLFLFLSILAFPNSRSLEIYPGFVKFFQYSIDQELEAGSYLMCDGRAVFVSSSKTEFWGYLSESYFSDRKKFSCSLLKENGQKYNFTLNAIVKPYNYKSEKLRVKPKRVKLSKSDQIIVNKQKQILEDLYQTSEGEFIFSSAFKRPLNTKVTSSYGKKRIFNKHHKTQHLGIDFKTGFGKKIPVSNKGRVVFAADLFYSGKTVIVDHGNRIFTLYGHLKRTFVDEGQLVDQGHIVGLSGATGRVTAPHLHWGVIINGNQVNGFSLIKESEKHFQNIKNINELSRK